MVIIHRSPCLGFEPVTVWLSAQLFNHKATPPPPEGNLSTENPTAGILSTILSRVVCLSKVKYGYVYMKTY